MILEPGKFLPGVVEALIGKKAGEKKEWKKPEKKEPAAKKGKGAAKKVFESDPDEQHTRQMEADFAAGQYENVLKKWPEIS